MSSQDTTRRAFLVRAVVGAGSVAGAGLLPDASAQNLDQHQDANAVAPQTHATGAGNGTFFNAQDAATVAAFTERLMPGAPGKPGALCRRAGRGWGEPDRGGPPAARDAYAGSHA